MLNMLKDHNIDLSTNEGVLNEANMIELEVRAIVDKVLELGDGDPVIGAIKGIDSGVLDHPVSNSKYVKCEVMGVKDYQGAVRYLEFGNLPFSKEIKEFHKQKIAEREKLKGEKVDFDTVISDFLSLSADPVVSKP